MALTPFILSIASTWDRRLAGTLSELLMPPSGGACCLFPLVPALVILGHGILVERLINAGRRRYARLATPQLVFGAVLGDAVALTLVIMRWIEMVLGA